MHIFKFITRLVIGAVLSIAAFAPLQAQAFQIIRDAETEAVLNKMLAPLVESAGIPSSSVSIHLIEDKSLNAFVANGLNLYVHTGLLMAADNANQVIGVFAHETGHMSGGHLSRIGAVANRSAATSLIASLLGAAAAVGAGRADIGVAIAGGGQALAERTFLSFTRSQENAADQAALKLLDATQQSSQGLYDFMDKLQGQELLISNNQDPYVRTHPLTTDRLDAIHAHLEKSPYSKNEEDPALEEAFQRVRAKLKGYFLPPQQTLRAFPSDNVTVEARYARAFAYSRIPEPNHALAELDQLLAVQPDDPYFLELKAQVLFEAGDVEAAIPPYRHAVEMLPESPLLRSEYGRVLLESKDPKALNEAVNQLKFSLSRDRRAPFVWRNLGIAYGRLGDIGRSSLALAEEAALYGRDNEVAFHAGRAKEAFPVGTPERLQADDLLLSLNNKKSK